MSRAQKIFYLRSCATWLFLCVISVTANVGTAQDVRPRYISNMRFAPSILTLTETFQGSDPYQDFIDDGSSIRSGIGETFDNRLSRWFDQTMSSAEGVITTRRLVAQSTDINQFQARSGLQADDKPGFEAGVRIPLGQHSDLMGSVGAEQSRDTARGDMRYRGRVSLRAAFRF